MGPDRDWSGPTGSRRPGWHTVKLIDTDGGAGLSSLIGRRVIAVGRADAVPPADYNSNGKRG